MKYFFSILLIILTISIFAQDVTKAQVVEGLTALRENIKNYNPALDDYNPLFDQQADLLISNVADETYSQIDYFKLISKLCVLSNEGHFAMGSWSDTPHSGFADDRYTYMPISVQIINGQIYLWSDYSNENVMQRGDEILEINGLSAKEIISELRLCSPSDGDIIGYADRSIGISFNWMYYLYIDRSETFHMKYKRLKGTEASAIISAVTRTRLFENFKARSTSENDVESIADVYELEINDAYAVLTLKSFTRSLLEKYDLKANKLYTNVFEEINSSGVGTLIVDLRNNSGGLKEYANDMVPYIMQVESNDPYLRKSISWSGKEKVMKLPKKSKNSFGGKVIVIVNAGTFSAASSLARFLKEYANAIVVGSETATRYEGFSAGSKQYVSVPHTDVQIGIPRYQTIYPESKKQVTTNRGLIPDYPITYSIDDIMEGKDLEMEFIINKLVSN